MNIRDLARSSINNPTMHGFGEETIKQIKKEKQENKVTSLKSYLPVLLSRWHNQVVDQHLKLLKHVKWATRSGLIEKKALHDVYSVLKESGKLKPGSINEKVRILSSDGGFVDFSKIMFNIEGFAFFEKLFNSGMSECSKSDEGFYEIKSEYSKHQLENLQKILFKCFKTEELSFEEMIDLYWIIDCYSQGIPTIFIEHFMLSLRYKYRESSCLSTSPEMLREIVKDHYIKKHLSEHPRQSILELPNLGEESCASTSKGKEKEVENKEVEEQSLIKKADEYADEFECDFLIVALRELLPQSQSKLPLSQQAKSVALPISRIQMLQDAGIVGSLLKKYVKEIDCLDCDYATLRACEYMKETGQIDAEFFQNITTIEINWLLSADMSNLLFQLFPNIKHIRSNFYNISSAPTKGFGLHSLKILHKNDGNKICVTLTSSCQYQKREVVDGYEHVPYLPKTEFTNILINEKDYEWLDLRIDSFRDIAIWAQEELGKEIKHEFRIYSKDQNMQEHFPNVVLEKKGGYFLLKEEEPEDD